MTSNYTEVKDKCINNRWHSTHVDLNKSVPLSLPIYSLKQAKLQKAQDDKKRNQQQQQQLKKNEEKARIKQIIDQAKIKDYDGDTAFNFQFNNKIKTLYLNKENYDALVAGSIGLCQIDNIIFLLPNATVNKINSINPAYVVLHQDKANTTPETTNDGPYADYEIPDDLMW